MMTKQKRIDEIVEILLEKRGIKTEKEKQEFFSPTHPEEISAKRLGISESGLEKAVKRIKKAIGNKEKIIVWGDYDVDGICASAILWETINSLGGECLPHIPSRFTEGYGLNVESIKKLKEKDPSVKLLITVDNGITAGEKIDFAKDLGIDVIITDHHQPDKVLPKAHAIIHTMEVSGAAVAWVLSRALVASGPTPALDHLGLAALGTVCDVLPLVGFNRSIVVHGLQELRRSTRPGIVVLCREAGIFQEEIDTYHIGFIIGPRLNAAGRVEHAMDALRLVCTKDEERATVLSIKLGETNKLRQDKTEWAVSHITESFGELWEGSLPKLLFAYHASYEEGVVGIAAGRLVDKYYRPAIVGNINGGKVKASARSITGVNIVDLIRQAGGGFLSSVGGHPMAAGFSLELSNLPDFEKRLREVFEKVHDEVLIRETRVDCLIDFSDISFELYSRLLDFAPYGFGNPQPVFATAKVFVRDARLVGRENEHLQLLLKQGEHEFRAIGFRMGEVYSKLSAERPINIVYSIELDSWNGNSRLQLKLKEIRS